VSADTSPELRQKVGAVVFNLIGPSPLLDRSGLSLLEIGPLILAGYHRPIIYSQTAPKAFCGPENIGPDHGTDGHPGGQEATSRGRARVRARVSQRSSEITPKGP
jgi:hypothetical protein